MPLWRRIATQGVSRLCLPLSQVSALQAALCYKETRTTTRATLYLVFATPKDVAGDPLIGSLRQPAVAWNRRRVPAPVSLRACPACSGRLAHSAGHRATRAIGRLGHWAALQRGKVVDGGRGSQCHRKDLFIFAVAWADRWRLSQLGRRLELAMCPRAARRRPSTRSRVR